MNRLPVIGTLQDKANLAIGRAYMGGSDTAAQVQEHLGKIPVVGEVAQKVAENPAGAARWLQFGWNAVRAAGVTVAAAKGVGVHVGNSHGAIDTLANHAPQPSTHGDTLDHTLAHQPANRPGFAGMDLLQDNRTAPSANSIIAHAEPINPKGLVAAPEVTAPEQHGLFKNPDGSLSIVQGKKWETDTHGDALTTAYGDKKFYDGTLTGAVADTLRKGGVSDQQITEGGKLGHLVHEIQVDNHLTEAQTRQLQPGHVFTLGKENIKLAEHDFDGFDIDKAAQPATPPATPGHTGPAQPVTPPVAGVGNGGEAPHDPITTTTTTTTRPGTTTTLPHTTTRPTTSSSHVDTTAPTTHHATITTSTPRPGPILPNKSTSSTHDILTTTTTRPAGSSTVASTVDAAANMGSIPVETNDGGLLGNEAWNNKVVPAAKLVGGTALLTGATAAFMHFKPDNLTQRLHASLVSRENRNKKKSDDKENDEEDGDTKEPETIPSPEPSRTEASVDGIFAKAVEGLDDDQRRDVLRATSLVEAMTTKDWDSSPFNPDYYPTGLRPKEIKGLHNLPIMINQTDAPGEEPAYGYDSRFLDDLITELTNPSFDNLLSNRLRDLLRNDVDQAQEFMVDWLNASDPNDKLNPGEIVIDPTTRAVIEISRNTYLTATAVQPAEASTTTGDEVGDAMGSIKDAILGVGDKLALNDEAFGIATDIKGSELRTPEMNSILDAIQHKGEQLTPGEIENILDAVNDHGDRLPEGTIAKIVPGSKGAS